MTFEIERYLIVGTLLLLLSIVSSKISGKFGIPSLIFFLGIGILAGSDGIGGIYFDNTNAAQAIGIIALVYILFAGGLDTSLQSIRPILKTGASLSTIGVLITCSIIGFSIHFLTDLSYPESFLLGAIVSSTDAAAVFMQLRSKGIHLKDSIRSLLEFESGANDPMAVFLTISFLEIITIPEQSPFTIFLSFFKQMGIGLVIGPIGGMILSKILNRLRLEIDGLYPVFSLAFIVLVYAITQMMGGSGFLAVYLTGLILGSRNFVHKKSLILFHDGVAWLMQIIMFLSLGLLVYPTRLPPVAGLGITIALILIFIARPIAVFVALYFSKFNYREKLLISWIGLRGSVPIILATYPYTAGLVKADLFFHLIFFIVLSSTLIQGTTITAVAKFLRLRIIPGKRIRFPIEYLPKDDLKNDLLELEVAEGASTVGKSVVELTLPHNSLILLIQRDGHIIVPRGTTIIEESDVLLLLAEKDDIDFLKQIFCVDIS